MIFDHKNASQWVFLIHGIRPKDQEWAIMF